MNISCNIAYFIWKRRVQQELLVNGSVALLFLHFSGKMAEKRVNDNLIRG